MQDIIIFAYTRAEAIADGVLVDVSAEAKNAGFRFPVAMTHAAWVRCVEIHDGCIDQDEKGRLWDVLMLLRFAISKSRDSSTVSFALNVRNGDGSIHEVTLKAICGPGDDLEPVITIMLPDED